MMKIFKMNDCDWWMAPTLEEAIQGVKTEHPMDWEDMIEDPKELTDAQLDSHKFRLDEGEEDGERKHCSFREELDRRVAAGSKTELFASTEY